MPPAFSTFHLSSAFLSIFPGHFSLQLGDWDICLPTHREKFCLQPASLPGIAFRTLTNLQALQSHLFTEMGQIYLFIPILLKEKLTLKMIQ